MYHPTHREAYPDEDDAGADLTPDDVSLAAVYQTAEAWLSEHRVQERPGVWARSARHGSFAVKIVLHEETESNVGYLRVKTTAEHENEGDGGDFMIVEDLAIYTEGYTLNYFKIFRDSIDIFENPKLEYPEVSGKHTHLDNYDTYEQATPTDHEIAAIQTKMLLLKTFELMDQE